MTNPELIAKLRDQRRIIANREGIELFMVLSNSTIEATASASPQTKDDLLIIKGWGPKKIDRYGDDFLKIINDPNSAPTTSNDNEEASPLDRFKTLSVSALLNTINQTLATLNPISVQGELIEVRLRAGMAFAKLKDPDPDTNASVSLFLNPMTLKYYEHILEEGQTVIITGLPSLFKNGNFNINVRSVEPVGEGSLKKAFEALKKKLEAKGYFDPARKRPLPFLVKNIGVITSRDGDAIHDFLQNIGNYGFNINLVNIRVEGMYAEAQIISAIESLNKNHPDLDVIVLIRGGGSLESLKAFNSELVAEAIITSRLPVLVGVGHDQDVSIADYVSDLACSTPTAISVYLRRHYENLIAQTDNYSSQLSNYFVNFINEYRHLLSTFTERLITATSQSLNNLKESLNLYEVTLNSLNPDTILKRGYSVITDSTGKTITSPTDTKIGDTIKTRFYKGSLTSRVARLE